MLSEQDLEKQVEGVTRAEIRLCVQRGWITPTAGGGAQAGFLQVDVARLRLIRELRQDLEVDDETVPVILSLIDQLHTTRAELKRMAQAVAQEPGDVQERIAATLRALRGS